MTVPTSAAGKSSKFAQLIHLMADFLSEERLPQTAQDDANAPAGRAASVAFVTPSNKVLLLRRADTEENFPGHWAFPGGKVDDGETHEQAARRESQEEIGRAPDALSEFDRKRTARDWEHVTYTAQANDEFVPSINNEHSAYKWCALDDLPSPIHPGVADTLKALAADKLGQDDKVSKASVDYSPGKGNDRCRNCQHYLGGSCELVAGDIASDYWCKKFVAAAVAHDSAPLALDRDSLREFDKEGHLHVALSNISKATINPYIGKEIPGWQLLGLQGDKVYKLLRDPKELEKGASTFNGLPLLKEHLPMTAATHKPELTVGALGNEAVYNHPYLQNSLVIWPESDIKGVVDDEKKELSAGYRYDADMTPGTYEGEAYDGVMRNIVGNHVALVEDGRAGPDVVVGDAKNPLISEYDEMKFTRTAHVAKGALLAFLAPRMAMDAKLDLGPVVASLTAKNLKAKRPELLASVTKVSKPLLAQDASIDGLEKVLDLIEGEAANGEDDMPVQATEPSSGTPAAAAEGIDEDPSDKIMEHLKTKFPEAHDSVTKMLAAGADELPVAGKTPGKAAVPAQDEDKDKDKVVDKPAMDAAITVAVAAERKRNAAIRDAERTVQPYVGQLAIACDSAEDVYRHALKTLNVNVDGVNEVVALKTILGLQPLPGRSKAISPSFAMDSAAEKGFGERFPGAAKIRSLS